MAQRQFPESWDDSDIQTGTLILAKHVKQHHMLNCIILEIATEVYSFPIRS